MQTLDTRGKISAAEIGFYFPIVLITFVLFVRHGLRRDAGWLFLFVFSSIKLSSGALLVGAELTQPTQKNLFIAAYVLQAAGLSPLMLSTLGFIGLAGQRTYSEFGNLSRILRFLGFIATVALALTVAGGVLSFHTKANQVHTGLILRRVGAGTFGVLYVLFLVVILVCWSYQYEMGRRRRKILSGVTFALPFLGVRVAYAILSAWSSSDLAGNKPSSNPKLAQFNQVTGKWVLFLVMALVMEYAMVLIFTITVISVPLRREY